MQRNPSGKEEDSDDCQRIIPVLDEKVVAGKRVVKTGSVQVRKRVEKHLERVSMPLIRETVEVRRVPVNRVVEAAPEVRTFGDTTIIPVFEEELVVTRRWVLKEEIHLTRRRTRQEESREIEVGTEHAEVTRLDASGVRVETVESPAQFPIGKHRPVLGKK